MAVRVLPDHVINQISAGEVIDRPASVIRELIDNSIDAKADDIIVHLEQGGRTLIKVSDNGEGMSQDDAVLAFERHATSKLVSAEDLTRVATLGFRGEALPSIASVSRMTLRTKKVGTTTAVEVVMDGGVLSSVRSIATNHGTEVSVEKLFFNTPARRKFLKEPRSEEIKVKQWIRQIAFAHPQVRFRIFSEGKEVLNIPRKSTFLERANAQVRGSTIDISSGNNGLYIEGVLAHPSQAKSDVNGLVIIVNRRVISDRMLLRAIREGFDSTLKDREFPVGVVSITIDPNAIDVNVHPQKSEIRFRNSQDVFLGVRLAVLNSIKQFRSPMISSLITQKAAPYLISEPPPTSSYSSSNAFQGSLAINSSLSQPSINIESQDLKVTPLINQFKYSSLQYISQIFECYLLFMGQDSYFYVMDMHAAHERCNYNLFRDKFRRGYIQSQNLLIPITIELDEEQALQVLSKQEIFSEYGIEIEEFGANGVIVRSAPSQFDYQLITQLVVNIATIGDTSDPSGSLEEHFDHLVARLACHASIRSGYRMITEEVVSLLNLLDNAELSSACPHGRPITVRFAREDLERWFGRDR